MNVLWLQHVVAFLLVAAVPVWDRLETRHVKRSSDLRVKVQSYRRVVAVLWALAALALAAMEPNDLLHPQYWAGSGRA